MIKLFLEKIISGQDLSKEEAAQVLEMIIAEEIPAAQAGAFLTALRMKGESISEILGFIETMEAHMVKVNVADSDAIDMCGTGGDASNSFNISTTAALIVAAGGVTVAKHGNRSISSKCGSADLLEAFGVNVMLDSTKVSHCIDQTGIGFFFAPLFHPAMKTVAPVRKSLEIRTVFNMLGPLLNPARVKRQLIGTFNLEAAEKISSVLSAKNYLKAISLHSDDGMDEVSVFADTRFFEIFGTDSNPLPRIYSPRKKYSDDNKKEIIGNSCAENKFISQGILNGKKSIASEMAVLNSAFGFYTADKVKTIEDGIELSETLIGEGKVLKKLNQLIEISNDIA